MLQVTISSSNVTSFPRHSVFDRDLRRMLQRMVSMLTRLIVRVDVVSEFGEGYNADVEYEYRGAE